MFHDYLSKFSAEDLRRALIDLFVVLDTKEQDRDPYMKQELAQFPYVNGGLFAKEDIEIPMLNDKVRDLLLTRASEDFDWSDISPTIFGAVFESTLNPETRRSGGMHYTSIENIHKVIDSLFLDELRDELNEIVTIKTLKTRKERIREFQDKISKLKFLDPACGSGNFLTETYLSLRRLENRGLEAIQGGQIGIGDGNISPIKVSIQQFYGIEINDFAVTVAKTALWIAEAQMMHETEEILHMNLKFLPLKSYANIIEDNALRIDWNDVMPNTECNYIMGNPPFVGARMMNESQKEDITNIFKGVKNSGNIDYVGCWYVKASEYMKNTLIEAALVSTNSICQGEQPAILWKPIMEKGIIINFAHKTFRWDSEASLKAHVHCIIVGFSFVNKIQKRIFETGKISMCTNINAYLVDAPLLFVNNRSKPISNIHKLVTGCQRLDNDNFMFTKEQMEAFIKKEPLSQKYFKRWYGAEEFINNKERYCLYLGKCEPSELKRMPHVIEILSKVKEYRANSNREQTKKYASQPNKFYLEVIPDTDYILIPVVSSERRRYIPMGFMNNNVLCSNQANMIPNATIFDFGILESNVHMAWMRAVAGRLEMRYRYSKDIVYNNFPWPQANEKQKEKIEKTAQMILDARAKYPESSLADLYDELTMPVELRKAHQENDKAVMEAYGFDWRKMTESDCVAELMKLYQSLVDKENI